MTNQKYLIRKTGTAKILERDIDNPMSRTMLNNVIDEIHRLIKEDVDFDYIDIMEYHAELVVEREKLKDKLESLQIESAINPNADYSEPIRTEHSKLDDIELAITSVKELL